MSKPSLGPAELESVRQVFESAWLGEGSVAGLFEERLKSFTGARQCVVVNTGTSALHLALGVLGVGPGDEVILPSLTFISDPMAVLMSGAKPVFGDIDSETWTLDPKKLDGLITRRTKVIMPTDYAGLPSATEAIREVIGDREIRIVRDASHSFGSKVRGRVLGAWLMEDITCFSFDPIKNITCGEGGALMLNDPDLASIARSKKRLGKGAGGEYSQPGFRYHLSDINAAIGLTQLDRFDSMACAKRRIARQYDELLSSCSSVRLAKRDYGALVPFMYVIRVEARHRDALVSYLQANGIHADLRYPPCHKQDVFRDRRTVLPVTDMLAAELLSLPLYADLSGGAVVQIVECVKQYFGQNEGTSLAERAGA